MPHEYAELAAAMVKQQIERRGVRDRHVLAAMREVQRHRFVPLVDRTRAYDDMALPTADGQTISQPYIVAVMTEMLALGDMKAAPKRVLEVGTGSGYQAAVLAWMGAQVVSIERNPRLADGAKWNLEQVGLADRVTVVIGDGTLGWPECAPYDRVIVTAAAPKLPEPLGQQVVDGGRIVIPIGSLDEQRLVCFIRSGESWCREDGIAVRFVPLMGRRGWAEFDDAESEPKRY